MRRILLHLLPLLLCFALFGCTGEQTGNAGGSAGKAEEQPTQLSNEKAIHLELSRESYYCGEQEELDYTIYNYSGQIVYLSPVPTLERLQEGQWIALEMQDAGICGTADAIETKFESSVPLGIYDDLEVGSYRLGFMTETAQGEALEMLYSQSFTMVDKAADMKVVSAKADGVKILLCNYAGEDYAFCSDYLLEYDDGVQWQQLKPGGDSDIIQVNTDYVLQAGQCVGMEIDWLNLYGALPEGEYRLTKELRGTETEGTLAVQTEFTLSY